MASPTTPSLGRLKHGRPDGEVKTPFLVEHGRNGAMTNDGDDLRLSVLRRGDCNQVGSLWSMFDCFPMPSSRWNC